MEKENLLNENKYTQQEVSGFNAFSDISLVYISRIYSFTVLGTISIADFTSV